PLSRSCVPFNLPSPPPLYTLSLHDALPISACIGNAFNLIHIQRVQIILHGIINSPVYIERIKALRKCREICTAAAHGAYLRYLRSEEHTSELQSRFDLVCRLLLEKKKKHTT